MDEQAVLRLAEPFEAFFLGWIWRLWTGRLRDAADQTYSQASEKVSQMVDRGREAYDRARSSVGSMATGTSGASGSTGSPSTGSSGSSSSGYNA